MKPRIARRIGSAGWARLARADAESSASQQVNTYRPVAAGISKNGGARWLV